MRVHISQHDIGLVDLKKKDQSDDVIVARIIAKAGRFSVFDATATAQLSSTIDRIGRNGWFIFDHTVAPYPWVNADLTPLGQQAIGDVPEDA